MLFASACDSCACVCVVLVHAQLMESGVMKKEMPASFLQEEWKKDLATLEDLVNKKEDERIVVAVLEELQQKGKHMLAGYKQAHVRICAFASSSLFHMSACTNRY